jgi:hypothetical protein
MVEIQPPRGELIADDAALAARLPLTPAEPSKFSEQYGWIYGGVGHSRV